MKQRVFVTGATGGMGFASLKEMLKDSDRQDIVILARNSEKNCNILKPYTETPGLEIVWGDLNNYDDVLKCVKGCDLILHIAAFVSPAADYYAVSKVAAERLVIESGLKYWVSLRKTGIIGRAMAEIEDAIMFHNCFDNVLEYCSDRDSARAMKNLCAFFHDGTLDESFWGHIYNIGGGTPCRISTYEMYRIMYGAIGVTNLDYMLSPKKEAALNFHGQYYLDGDKLENYLHFRHDSMQYFYDCYLENLGALCTVSKILCKLPGGQRIMGSILRRRFDKLARTEHGTLHFIEDNVEDHIDAYWGGRKRWEALPDKLSEMQHFTNWDAVVPINHGYDETKRESELDIADMRQAAQHRNEQGRLERQAGISVCFRA